MDNIFTWYISILFQEVMYQGYNQVLNTFLFDHPMFYWQLWKAFQKMSEKWYTHVWVEQKVIVNKPCGDSFILSSAKNNLHISFSLLFHEKRCMNSELPNMGSNLRFHKRAHRRSLLKILWWYLSISFHAWLLLSLILMITMAFRSHNRTVINYS